ncbi:MAG TPA: hypothetical protein VN700_18420 [Vicinamibacterales bacterium]|nr:hypothetical protein [Vicinamibacterales bacterium]
MNQFLLDVLTALSFLLILGVPWAVFLRTPAPERTRSPWWLPFCGAVATWFYLVGTGHLRVL